MMMGLEEEIDLDLASLSFDVPKLDATKDIKDGEKLNVTKPSILAERYPDLALNDLNRTQDLPQPSRMSDREPLSGDNLANITHNLDANLTKGLGVNFAKDLDANLSKDLDSNVTNILEFRSSNNFCLNLTQDLEEKVETNLTQNLDPIDSDYPMCQGQNLNSTKTLDSNKGVPTEERLTFSQFESLSLQDQEYSVPGPLGDAALATQSQSELNSTKTLNTTAADSHFEETSEISPEYVRTPEERTIPADEMKKGRFGETVHTFNVLRETTNNYAESDGHQHTTLERRQPIDLGGKKKGLNKMKPFGGRLGLKLQKRDHEDEEPKKIHSDEENFSCQFKQPAMPLSTTCNLIRQRSTGSLRQPVESSSVHSVDSRTTPQLENKLKTLKKQSSAGCGVRTSSWCKA